MNIKKELWQILIGALLMTFFLEMGWLDPAKNFFTNVLTAVVIAVISRVVARILGH